ncbi:uncharacterized protein LOC117171610 [Belonocnema kinseyi]|uniref:uncharacterized protein LOC117171610 n=1 Tax=Belonocnema kinseyi TaxID=2817044 RepID=UPI00143CF2E6|nr:uncharacterized protein LOC117171610 [Belonocnema kinseyi]
MSGYDWEKIVLSTLKDQQNEKNTDYRYNPMQYTFYSIVNSSVGMDQGSYAAAIALSFKNIHNTVDDDEQKREFLEKWKETGEKIIVLKACNQKHLKYLKRELQYVALATHTLSQYYGTTCIALVLTVFGRQDNLHKWLDGLPVLK